LFSQGALILFYSLFPFQGIFVSVLYCFMNSEVQTALRNAYLRAAIRRNPNKERPFLRGNFSQTSTVFLS
ncbi:unnamed protein product, partial [Ixodes pacificus]